MHRKAIVQQLGEPCATLEQALDHLASVKYIPGHVFSYLDLPTLRVVMLFELDNYRDDMKIEGQTEVLLGEPVLAGLCPPAQTIREVQLKVEHLSPMGESLGIHVIKVPLLPETPVSLVGQNRVLVPVTEHVVPDEMKELLRNRKIGVEIMFPEAKILRTRGKRSALRFLEVVKVELGMGYPQPI